MQNLIERIQKIEALISGATSEGEKNAAISARDRILKKYPELDENNKLVEYKLSTPDFWHKKLLIAICRKYGIRPYRYHRQKHTTVMVKINERFLNEVVWKEYTEFSSMLDNLIIDITDDLISKIHSLEEEDIVKNLS